MALVGPGLARLGAVSPGKERPGLLGQGVLWTRRAAAGQRHALVAVGSGVPWPGKHRLGTERQWLGVGRWDEASEGLVGLGRARTGRAGQAPASKGQVRLGEGRLGVARQGEGSAWIGRVRLS